MQVIKASGEKQQYSSAKLCRSVMRVGVSRPIAQKICQSVESVMRPEISTAELAQKTSRYIRKEHPAWAARYSLKKAMMDLGPHGFLFEQFVAGLLGEYGYATKTNQMVRGKCLTHEIDIIAQRGSERYVIEAKYHNRRGVKTDAQVAMYMYARVLDIGQEYRGWLVTNTKFTSNAKRYGHCMGVHLTGWEYPAKESLEELIAQKALYPVTVLPSVRRSVREQLFSQRILFARDVLAKKPRIPSRVSSKLFQEASDLVR
jgi:Holliday junction resolvase-like predicted endonuclease